MDSGSIHGFEHFLNLFDVEKSAPHDVRLFLEYNDLNQPDLTWNLKWRKKKVRLVIFEFFGI